MTLYQLEVFALVAKLQSFTNAAKELHVGQPSISALMTQLQKELGVKLFEKLGIKTRLTDAGKRLLERTENILGMVEKAKEEIEDLKGFKKGKISVGSAGIGTYILISAIEQFKKRYPGVDISLTIENTGSLQQKLLNGEVDVAILGRTPRSPSIIVEPHHEEELVVIASPKHPLTHRRSVSLERLIDEPLIVYESDDFGILTKFAEKGLSLKPLLQIKLQMGSRDAVKSAVASGLGLSFLAKSHVLADVRAGRLKILKVPQLSVKRLVCIAVHKRRQNLPYVRAFAELLRNSQIH